MNDNGLRIIVTGGTFDKVYDEIKGEMTFRDSHLPEILKTARVSKAYTLEFLRLVDSLFMRDEERLAILESCKVAQESNIVVTHGTDSMVETAHLIGKAQLAKTIVLTGAMLPYQIQGSDAVFNFGCAFAAAQILPFGVYLAMNGRIFPWNSVRKDKQIGEFVDA